MAWSAPASAVPGQLVTAAWLNQYLRDNMNALMPVGSLIYRVANVTGVETAVEGRWLECNGVAVSRTTYSTLFNYLNSLAPALPFGAGNGSTTFNLPDFRGRMPVVHPTAFVDDTAQIIGDVEIGAESSVWMNVVVRGDVHRIRIGDRSNVQDGTIVHAMKNQYATTIGDVLTKINAAAPTRLSAALSSDGRRLEVSDLTTGSSAFSIATARP